MQEQVLSIPRKSNIETHVWDILKRDSDLVASFIFPISSEKKKAFVFHHSSNTTLLMQPINENAVFDYIVFAYGEKENIEKLKNQIHEYRGMLVGAET